MAHSSVSKDKLKRLYVQGLTLAEAARSVGMGYNSARGIKSRAKASGDDWDIAHAARIHSSAGTDNQISILLTEFYSQFQATINALKEDKRIKPLERATALASLMDSFSKITKAARMSDPKAAQYAIALDVTTALGEFIKNRYPDIAKTFFDAINEFGPELTRLFAKN